VQYYTIVMSELEKKRIDREFELFTARNFEKPKRCKNLGQIQYYLIELANKVEDFKCKFNYVPNSAYQLLAQYNARQNSILYKEFKNTY